MAFDLSIFNRNEQELLNADYLDWLVDERSVEIQAHFGKLWEYYTNPVMDLHQTSAGSVGRKVNESGK